MVTTMIFFKKILFDTHKLFTSFFSFIFSFIVKLSYQLRSCEFLHKHWITKTLIIQTTDKREEKDVKFPTDEGRA